jgi:hypothetical protein
MPAAAYLGVPAGPQLVKTLMRGVFTATLAEVKEPFGPVARQNLEPSEYAAPAITENPAGDAGTPMRQGEANALQNVVKCDGQGGTGDHGVLRQAPPSLH